jgi:predicted metal-dependent hydrolase
MTVAESLPDTMLIGDLLFEVHESTRRSTVGITVDRDGSLKLHAPTDCQPSAVAAWAQSKRMWVYHKLAEKDLLLSARPAKKFVTGEGFAYLGRCHRLLVAEVDWVRMERGRLLLPSSLAADTEAAPAALIAWYRDRGRQWLPNRLRQWTARVALEPAGLDVRDLGYRWGSLSGNGRLNIHWATLQLPPSLVDYVLVHELAHIAHARHTSAFWATVERALPDFERRKSDLISTGAALWLG